MQISDEMVEKAAAGYWNKVCSIGTARWPDDVSRDVQDIFREGCRAALEAALSAAEPRPAPAVAEEIADAVLSWMVKYDLLDAGNEYRASEVLAVLDDFKPSYQSAPSEAVKASPEALEEFTAYFVKNYPGPDTIIFNPKWHAPKIFRAAVSALSAQVQDARSDDDEETYQIGVRDGYSQAVQEIDRLTGGDGEYRYCTDHDPERHTPGPAEMIQRIVERFETLNLIGDAEKRGDFWDAPGSAQVQDVATAASPADQIIGQIEELFPNWRSYRDLVDCITCEIHDLRQRAEGR